MTAPKPHALDALRSLLADVRVGADRRRELDAALDAVAAALEARDPLATDAAVADACATAFALGYIAASREAADIAQRQSAVTVDRIRALGSTARTADHERRSARDSSPLRRAVADAMREGAARAEDAIERATTPKDPDR